MTINPNTKVKVKNRSIGSVVYNIPEKHVRREFYPRETKTVSYEEICEVIAQPGGRELFYNYLFIEDENILHEALNIQEQPEYWITEENLPSWIQTCTLDEFKDGLDYAPGGIKALIKKIAVELPLNDMAKATAIKEQLGFDVMKAIEMSKADAADGTTISSAPVTTPRRSAPNYKVVSKPSENN